jgi:glycerophosphoryl diester phosphodiesterase
MRKHLVVLGVFILFWSCTPQQEKKFIPISDWKNLSPEHVMVVAHRGDWRNAPENSLQAIQNCIDMGVDIVEIDVHRTRDGHLILLHDKKLDRTTTGKGFVSDWTLDSIRTLRLKNGYGLETDHQVPTLEEALKLARNEIIVFIDKGYNHISQTYRLLDSMKMVDQVFFEGNKSRRQLLSDYPDLADRIYYAPRISGQTNDLRNYVGDFLEAGNSPVFISAFETEHDPVLLEFDTIRRHHVRVMATTLWKKTCAGHTDDLSVSDPEEGWGWVIGKGTNVICTDRPALLLENLRQKGKHP